MLVLTRKIDEQIVIQLGAETVVVRVLSVVGDRVRLGFVAPLCVPIHRHEIARRSADHEADAERKHPSAVTK